MPPHHPLKDEEESRAVFRLNCEECTSFVVVETSKRLMTRIQGHKSAVRRHGINSHTWAHMSESGHVVGFKKAKVKPQAKSKGSRLVKEARLSGPNALNRSIELCSSFFTLWHKLQQEDKGRINSRNNSNNDNQQNEQLSQTGESHIPGGDNKIKGTKSRGPIPRVQNTDKHDSLTTCFNRTMAACNTNPYILYCLYSHLFIIRKFIQ